MNKAQRKLQLIDFFTLTYLRSTIKSHWFDMRFMQKIENRLIFSSSACENKYILALGTIHICLHLCGFYSNSPHCYIHKLTVLSWRYFWWMHLPVTLHMWPICGQFRGYRWGNNTLEVTSYIPDISDLCYCHFLYYLPQIMYP